jgi:hypothetical protein
MKDVDSASQLLLISILSLKKAFDHNTESKVPKVEKAVHLQRISAWFLGSGSVEMRCKTRCAIGVDVSCLAWHFGGSLKVCPPMSPWAY